MSTITFVRNVIFTVLAVSVAAAAKVLANFFLSARLNQNALLREVNGKHVLVTGGSKGLGLALARLLVKNGANVTIVARGQKALDEARRELQQLAASNAQAPKILAVSIDLSKYDQVVQEIDIIRGEMGKIDWVIANAGSAAPGFLANQLDLEFEGMIHQNLFSVANLVRALLKSAKQIAEDKHIIPGSRTWPISGLSPAAQSQMPTKIIFVGSVCSALSFLGYSAYGASKFGLRGFADGLRSEFAPLGIAMHVYLPANMDTPGFAVENETKPEITAQIEGTGSTLSADDAASALFAGVLKKRYLVCNDVVGELVRVVANGAVPRPNPITEAFAAPALVLAFAVWSLLSDYEVATYFKTAPKPKKASTQEKQK
ncbi:3-dehydrosphinganine reductase [Physocladia obscura]|uniref:3-dehydrosphinganine reductase n=1 Tax=Physocladia obscura TaxID=109957 RepID=A0AAD5T0N8_9FUNG|nr:3-dehydrosphinganine reductase [Physocladia obscura]